MVPRKKRTRYRLRAKEIVVKYSLPDDPNRWDVIWNLIDRYGLKDEEHSYVYAICDKVAKAVKFGKSIRPGVRLKELQISTSSQLKIWAFCLETKKLNERVIHERMAAHRITGEWFHLNEETQKVIDEIRTKAGV